MSILELVLMGIIGILILFACVLIGALNSFSKAFIPDWMIEATKKKK